MGGEITIEDFELKSGGAELLDSVKPSWEKLNKRIMILEEINKNS
ncbi:hypothetical protein [Clostridium saccharoperbutylacetonicum]